MPSCTLMIQGTGSNTGKSTVAAGLCRLLYRRGISVAPFKPQNMALNSAVTVDGGEIGRAQAVQAQACGLDAHTDMNPVLLKPNGEIGAQVIIQGRVFTNMDAAAYHNYKPKAMVAVLDSFRRLASRFHCIIAEGAGSPAEINLRQGDLANMGFAEHINCPVLLVANIDRGGVFAQIIGTLAVLSQSEQDRIKGFIINQFRGDLSLLKPGIDWLEKQTGKRVLGVLPHLQNLHIEAEDSLSAPKVGTSTSAEAATAVKVAVLSFPQISNQTDFDPLRLHPNVKLTFVERGQDIPPCDLIVLPGSKNVFHDLLWLRANGWEEALKRHLRYGGKLLGICGGFQMLGRALYDPHGIESSKPMCQALNLLDMETTLEQEKKLSRIQGTLCLAGNAKVTGYEIHMGKSSGSALMQPAIIFENGSDGAISADRQIIGTYWHGIFDHGEACAALLSWAGLSQLDDAPDYRALTESQLNRLADAIESHTDIAAILEILRINNPLAKHGKHDCPV